jgi:hypothetical protein
VIPNPDSDKLEAAIDAFRRMAVPDPPVILLTARPDRRWRWACAALALTQCLTLAGWALYTPADPGRQGGGPTPVRSAPEPPPDSPEDIPRVALPIALLSDPDRLPPPVPEKGPFAAVITTAGSYRALGLD